MPSTYTTDPIGPRSIDEMLGVVYSRAEHHRRRRTAQRVGIAAVAMLVASAGVVTLNRGDPEARVKVVDRPDAAQTEEAIAPPPIEAAVDPVPGVAASGSTGGTQAKDAQRNEVDATVRKPEGVPTLPARSAPAVENWADGTDKLNDSQPGDWYFDISSTSMQFDSQARVVVFTTSYRLPDAPLNEVRKARNLRSRFDYEAETFSVAVVESENQLGIVRIDDSFDCEGCEATFDAAAGVLRMAVPLAQLNKAVDRKVSPLASGADIWSLQAVTIPAANITPSEADASEVA